jgi:hypothetical protein
VPCSWFTAINPPEEEKTLYIHERVHLFFSSFYLVFSSSYLFSICFYPLSLSMSSCLCSTSRTFRPFLSSLRLYTLLLMHHFRLILVSSLPPLPLNHRNLTYLLTSSLYTWAVYRHGLQMETSTGEILHLTPAS